MRVHIVMMTERSDGGIDFMGLGTTKELAEADLVSHAVQAYRESAIEWAKNDPNDGDAKADNELADRLEGMNVQDALTHLFTECTDAKQVQYYERDVKES